MRSFKAVFKIVAFLVVFCILAGIASYYLEPIRATTRILLQELYTQEEEITTLLVGASRFRRGIDPYIIQDQLGGNAFMLTFGTQTPIDSYFLIKEALKTNTPELVVLDMSYRTFVKWEDMRSDLIWAEIKPSLDKAHYLLAAIRPEDYLSTIFPVFSDTNREIFLADDYELAENLELKNSQKYKDYDFYFATSNKSTYVGKGFIYVEKPIKRGTLGDVTFEKWSESNFDARKLDYYNKTIALCKEKGVPVILIDMPLPLASIVGQKNYADYEAYAKAYAESHGIPYINFCFLKKELYPQSDSLYFDRNHMSYEGSQLFSPILAQVIEDYQQGDLNLSDYLYSSYEETLTDNPHIYSTWLVKSGKALQAKSYYGINVTPEYQFQYKEKSDDKYEVIQAYGKSAKIDISKYKTGFVRVNCRTAGTDSKWEQYDVYKIG